jgi:hypothetical protein
VEENSFPALVQQQQQQQHIIPHRDVAGAKALEKGSGEAATGNA